MRPDDDASLTWTTPPLAAALEVLGAPVARLVVRVDRPVAQVAVRLEHVHPDGRSALATRGILNLTRRTGAERPEPVPTGEPLAVDVRLQAVGLRIRAGDRLRVAVAGCDWPTAWPRPCPSCSRCSAGAFLLPRPDAAAEVDPPAAPTPVSAPALALAHDEVPATWELVHEAVAGVTRSRAASGWSTRLPDGGRSAGSIATEASIADDDPASCRVEARATATVLHDGVEAHARGHLVVHGDAEELHVAVELVVERDGAVIAERSFGASAPRDLL